MKPNATALANYFIDLSLRDGVELRQLGLMKRVYITHGFCLAISDRPAINERFDKVEAWKNGPCIPSIYHSFKYNRNNPITEKSCFIYINPDQKDGDIEIILPVLEDKQIKDIAGMVWEKYKKMSDYELVKLTHKQGTPWALCYVEEENRPIPDIYTKLYYKKLVK
jgi:uncharacterized phage-associated protein